MIRSLRSAAAALALMTVLTGIAYPLALTSIAQLVFPARANGSLIARDGRVLGSELVGQSFTSERWFHGRPSATAARPYDATASSGSNLGPRSEALHEAVAARIFALRAQTPGARAIPVDLVTSSASGLDPHLSPDAALFQVERVAAARGLDAARVRALVNARIEPRWLGLFGEPHVNVLLLNLALEALR